ncbi:MAG: hypothetical protein ABIR16_09230 [Dokdonella sp.]
MSDQETKDYARSAERPVHEAVAERTGISLATVIWISSALAFSVLYRRKGKSDHHVDAVELCRMLVADLDEHDADALGDRLHQIGIHSSRDIGRVIYALIDTGFCTPTESDAESDFASVFEADQIDAYLRQTGIHNVRDWPMVLKSVIVWAFYLGGLALLLARNQRLMTHVPIWAGGLAFFLGWMLSRSRFPKRMRFGLPWSSLERRAQRIP